MAYKMDQTRVSSPGANNNATVTLAAPGAGKSHVIWRIDWSYSSTPTGGNLTITDGTATVYELDITAAGVGSVDFPTGAYCDPNAAVTIDLNAGGTGVLGKVNVQATVEGAI